MNRDEILQRSRAEKEDEGNTFLENRGRRFGVVGFCTMYILLVVFNFATGQSSYALHALFWGYTALDGSSLNATPLLRDESKLLVALLMFVGRVGLITLMLGIVKQKKNTKYRYPSDDIIIN